MIQPLREQRDYSPLDQLEKNILDIIRKDIANTVAQFTEQERDKGMGTKVMDYELGTGI